MDQRTTGNTPLLKAAVDLTPFTRFKLEYSVKIDEVYTSPHQPFVAATN
jgi:hypothetical protein